jgi:hypothetical protein
LRGVVEANNAHIHRAAVSELTIEKPRGPAAPVKCVVMRAKYPMK